MIFVFGMKKKLLTSQCLPLQAFDKNIWLMSDVQMIFIWDWSKYLAIETRFVYISIRIFVHSCYFSQEARSFPSIYWYTLLMDYFTRFSSLCEYLNSLKTWFCLIEWWLLRIFLFSCSNIQYKPFRTLKLKTIGNIRKYHVNSNETMSKEKICIFFLNVLKPKEHHAYKQNLFLLNDDHEYVRALHSFFSQIQICIIISF